MSKNPPTLMGDFWVLVGDFWVKNRLKILTKCDILGRRSSVPDFCVTFRSGEARGKVGQ